MILMPGSGGAGLVGGALLMDAFEDHEDNVRDQAYDQGISRCWCVQDMAKHPAGYDNGYDNGNDGGDYGGGGDW